MKNKLALFALLLTSSPAHAATLPEELMYNGSPISAGCMDFIGDSSVYEPRNLANCVKSENALAKQAPGRQLDKDTIGYDYTADGKTHPVMSDYYRYIGKAKDGFIIYTENATGGSGYFTGIHIVNRKGDTIQLVRSIAGGDRCSGGLSDVAAEGSGVSYNASMTPWSLVTRTLPEKSEAYQFITSHVSGGAMSCIGHFHYLDETLKSAEIDTENLAALDTESEDPVKNCFKNELALTMAQWSTEKRATLKEGKMTLTTEMIKEFSDHFIAACTPVKTAQTPSKPKDK